MKLMQSLLTVAALCLAPILWAKEVRELDWLEMMPQDEVDALTQAPTVDHTGMFKMEQTGSFRTIPDLDKQQVKIAGYIVPVEVTADNKLKEFFIVPYFGACIHVPPPPPNQIIYARLESPIDMTEIYDAFWIEGQLNVETIHNDLASSAYTMDVRSVTLWE